MARHHSRTSSSLSRPFSWPTDGLPRPRARANRRFPSMIIATWPGTWADFTWFRSRRSYAWYAASDIILEMSVAMRLAAPFRPLYLAVLTSSAEADVAPARPRPDHEA